MPGMTGSTNPVDSPSISSLLKPVHRTLAVETRAKNYLRYFDSNQNEEEKGAEEAEEFRKQHSMDVSNNYYDLATDFYEYGWGQSFHFAVLRAAESRDHSFAKYEYTLALKLDLKPEDLVLDVGCGIGGPARNISIFSESSIVGVNCNEYQLTRARDLTRQANLDHLCSFLKGDFNMLPFDDNSYDKAYAIEATCHSDDLSKVYGQVCRVLKPGGMFAVYEWVLTDRYDPSNPRHRKLKEDIVEGTGLPKLVTMTEARGAMEKAGFEMVYSQDRARSSSIPWYSTLQPSWSLSGFRGTSVGRTFTNVMLTVLETLHLAPKGSVTVHRTLCKGADGLAAAGEEGIFTPMFLMVGRKPVKPSN